MWRKICLISVLASNLLIQEVSAEGIYNTQIEAPTASQYGSQMYQYSNNLYTTSTKNNNANNNVIVITPYVVGGYYLSFAEGQKDPFIDYKSSFKKLQHGFMVGTGIIINNNYGFGISFNQLFGQDNLSKDDQNFNALNLNLYMLNLDAFVIIPFTFYDKLHLYVIGGINGIFGTIKPDYKNATIDVNIANSMNKNSLGVNIGGGIEYKVAEKFYVRAEAKRVFVLTPAIVQSFWMTGLSLMYKI